MQSDRPIARRDEDLLARASFAGDVARRLTEGAASDPWVGAIYGEWGDGKTSVLNLVHAELNQHSDLIALRFDPWQLRSSEDLLPRFFEEIAAALSERSNTKIRKLTRALEGYARHLDGLQPPTGLLGGILGLVGRRLLYPSLEAQRARISTLLSALQSPVIVIIDELDRLAPHDLVEMLRLVRLVADFPYTRYLLAFDPEVVAGAIQADLHIADGRAFLKKIVQVPLLLPSPPPSAARDYFLRAIHERISALKAGPTEEDVGNYYRAWFWGFSDLPFTLRDAKRLINLFDSYTTNVLEELNALDLLLLITVRDRWPALYKWLSERKPDLTKFHDHRSNDRERDRLGPDFKNAMETVSAPEKEAARDLLNRLIPQFGPLWRGSSMGWSFQESWGAARRLCSPMYFERYFHFGVPGGQVSERERLALRETLRSGASQSAVTTEIARWREAHDAGEVLDALAWLEKQLDAAGAASLLLAMSANATDLSSPKGEFSFLTPRYRWAMLMVELLLRTNEVGTAAFEEAARNLLLRLPLPIAYSASNILCSELKDRIDPAGFARIHAPVVLRIRDERATLLDRADSVPNALWFSRTLGDQPGHKTLMAELTGKPMLAARLVLCYLDIGTEVETGDQHLSDMMRESYDGLTANIDAAALDTVLRHKFQPSGIRVFRMKGMSPEEFAAQQFFYMDNLVRMGPSELKDPKSTGGDDTEDSSPPS